MKKIKFTAAVFAHTGPIPANHVVRLEVINEVLVARYFCAQPAELHDGLDVHLSLPAFDPMTTPLLRQIIKNGPYIAGEAVTNEPTLQGRVFRETGRHIFRAPLRANTVLGHWERQDFSAFAFPFDAALNVSEPYNHFVDSVSVKGEIGRNSKLRNAQTLFLMYVDEADASINQWTLCYITSPMFLLEDTTQGEWEVAPAGLNYSALLPQVSLSAPANVAPDGWATVNVTLNRDNTPLAYDGEMVIEAVSGYLPKQRLQVHNGTASFRAMALGLQSGDALRVKVGTRLISGMASVSIEVA
jgi:hypothetical protein